MGGPPGFYTGPERTPILDSVVEPRDMNGLSLPELKQLAHELRWDTIRAVSKTGGHLGSSCANCFNSGSDRPFMSRGSTTESRIGVRSGPV